MCGGRRKQRMNFTDALNRFFELYMQAHRAIVLIPELVYVRYSKPYIVGSPQFSD